jgi:prephenate dehydrogenase
MRPKRLTILGVGLLGGSIGLAVRSVLSGCQIVGYGHRASTLSDALAIGAIQESKPTAAEAVRGADLVILCTPVGVFEPILQEIAPHLASGALITDVGSTKRTVVALAEKLLPRTVAFVGSHPMAGSEKRGIKYADANLFRDAVCITTPTPHTRPEALEKIESFWKLLGMHLVRLSPEEHDRRLADVSHLPHALAAALVSLQEDASLPLAGKGFLDSTRVAGGDGGLWRDIFIDNRDNLRDSIRRCRSQLDRLAAHLESGDSDAIKAWLDAASARRRGLR